MVKEKVKNEEEKQNKNKKLIQTVFNFVFWIGISVLAAIWLIEFFLVKNDQDPLFCLDTKYHQFDDGDVTECIGLGYKIYNYERESLTAREFGPFFVGMRD